MNRGDIHIAAARGPYTGKPRPVVVIQDDRFDATASVTVCPLTTDPLEAPMARVRIEPTRSNGIDQLSHLMVDKITTIPRANMRGRLGRLNDADLGLLDRALNTFLGLGRSGSTQ
jgi:mRNA interferase MazF